MENQQETLKLLGIDSPEVKRHEKKKKQAQKHGIPLEDIAKKGEIALSQCKKLLLPGTSIALEYNTRDSQNRILAIVYLPNGKMLNTYLLEQGLVFANLSFGIAYKEELEMAHQRARNNKVGIWDKHEAN
jgi:endonuclease YncB( thermonuclease family)